MTAGRFPRLPVPLLAPGFCFTCRKEKCGSGFTDTQITDDWLGRFYLCDDCLMEMGRGAGMRSAEEVEVLVADLGQARVECERLTVRLRALETIRVLVQEAQGV